MLCSLLLTVGVSISVGQDELAPARIVVRLPGRAALFVDGEKSLQAGDTRVLTTPPLEPGHDYFYLLLVEGKSEGEDYRLRKKVSFRAGETIVVTFRMPVVTRDGPSKNAAKSPKALLSSEEQLLLELTNKERKEAGLPPLAPDRTLAKAARDHSANMARQGRLDHVLDDKGPAERVREAGYEGFGWGENIAFGQQTPAQAIEVWMNSPGHRANILGEQYTHLGIGIARDRRGIAYYTQVFGNR